MAVPDWIWLAFIFAFGCCIGSFLNVVIYRLPRDKSLIRPPSACPACGRHIRFYDNIPLISWLVLGRKCRYCKAPISPRYFVVELSTGLVFMGLFLLYFRSDVRPGMVPFSQGGWFIYLLHIILLSALVAASAVDLELWVIPVSICWFVITVGLIGSAVGSFVIDSDAIREHFLLPTTSAVLFREVTIASLAAGAAIGLGISLLLLATGLIRRSYDSTDEKAESDAEPEAANGEREYNHRLEMCKEMIFLLPIIICAVAAYWLVRESAPGGYLADTGLRTWWLGFSQRPVVAGLLGSACGYFIGGAIVWAARILGTLAFGKEAMGLGDVHLMGAAGAVIGPVLVVVAFFIAPFLGLGWASFQMFFKKTRQIPYGPFLSLGVFAVMILHDRIFNHLISIFYR